MGEYEIIKELVSRYNKGEIFLNDQEAEQLATKAYQYGLDFDVQSKGFRKGFFDAADMASFGLIPNEWRPTSPGQALHGEPGFDKFMGGVGTLGGLATGIGAGIKGGKMLFNTFAGSKTAGKAATALSRVKETEAMKRSKAFAQNLYNKGNNFIDPVPSFTDFRFPI